MLVVGSVMYNPRVQFSIISRLSSPLKEMKEGAKENLQEGKGRIRDTTSSMTEKAHGK